MWTLSGKQWGIIKLFQADKFMHNNNNLPYARLGPGGEICDEEDSLK